MVLGLGSPLAAGAAGHESECDLRLAVTFTSGAPNSSGDAHVLDVKVLQPGETA
jgi:hypothetical protein